MYPVMISRLRTEAVAALARSSSRRSCVRKAASRQTPAPAAPPAHLLLPVLSACPGPGPERLRMRAVRWRGSERSQAVSRAPELGRSAAGSEIEVLCSPEKRGPMWTQGPAGHSPCSPPPCPVPQCRAAYSPHCRKN